jgi:hypothetical protein
VTKKSRRLPEEAGGWIALDENRYSSAHLTVRRLSHHQWRLIEMRICCCT